MSTPSADRAITRFDWPSVFIGMFSITLGEKLAKVESVSDTEIYVPDAATPLTDEQEAWLKKAESDRTTELERVRTTAKDWASTIAAVTGATGIVALIKGPSELDKLTTDWKRAVAIAALLAVLAALRGTVLAAVAAQGVPHSFSYEPDEYSRQYRRETIRAARELQISRVLVVVATLATIVAVGGLWFGDQKSVPSILVVAVSDGKASDCGTAGLADNGKIVLTRTDGTTAEFAPETVTALIPVATCPKKPPA